MYGTIDSNHSLDIMDNKEWVNGLDRKAILKTKSAMSSNKSLGLDAPVSVKAVWEQGKVTGVDGKLVCYAPPEMQFGKVTKGPSINSFCPLVSAGCFCLVMMLKAAEDNLQFQEVTSNTKADANLIGFFKKGWKGDQQENGFVLRHPWKNGINLGVVIRSEESQETLNGLADHANKHCPSSELMKRDFPVDVNYFRKNATASDKTDWDEVPVFYNMEKYKEISKLDKYMVKQEANMTWHCQNENKLHPNSVMSFSFPSDSESTLVLGFDPPVGAPNPYANPVQGCFFGGLASFLHTIAARIYAHGYKVAKIEGEIKTKVNKRKVFAADKTGYIFSEGASILVSVVSNAPNDIIAKVQNEAEQMSPTMMNWREELPFMYGVAKLHPRNNDGVSVYSELSENTDQSPQRNTQRKGRGRILNFFWKLSHKLGQESY